MLIVPLFLLFVEDNVCPLFLFQAEQLDAKLQKLKQKLASGTGTLPYSVRSEQLLEIDSLGKRLKESARGCLRYGISLQNIVIESV
jgi:hypothetical protein